ncbi:MAG: sulfatase-like hydrolase/transferase [Nitrospira sp.]|nr:sulfatase-like hydrolase/transferase [Candidatus Brocadiales bacterium]MBL7049768.1 sulfatase-like hydrolase/transferase [Nitrospira sp.]
MIPFKITYWKVFRLTFVVFSLYLLKDAFYRWDGFSFYATLAEFVPSVALVSIFWSILALATAVVVWMGVYIVRIAARAISLDISAEQVLVCMLVLFISGVSVWGLKRYIVPDYQTSFALKIAVALIVVAVSFTVTWIARGKSERYISALNDRITPLVWIFGAFILFSVPYVGYVLLTAGPPAPEQYIPTADIEERPNILLVTFDTMTSRDMSLYGYDRPTTPFISRWAEDAAVFTRNYASCNMTTPAAASMMTGKRVWTHNTYHIRGTRPNKSATESLPLQLKQHGYYNIAYIVNYVASVNELGISNAFDVAPLATEFAEPQALFGWRFGYADIILYNLFSQHIRLHEWIVRFDFLLTDFVNLFSRDFSELSVPAEKAFDMFTELAGKGIPTPYFAWIHVYPPHYPYLPPEPFAGLYSATPELRTFRSQENVWRLNVETEPIIYQLMRERYDELINYSDNRFENFIAGLEKLGVLNNTVVILSADHGESFEHDYREHAGPHLYEQVTHIPLVIKEYDRKQGQIIDSLVEQIDLPATILDLAGITVPDWMEGRSLLPLMRGESLSERPVFSMNFENNRSLGSQIDNGSIAVWEGDYKLIHYLNEKRSLLFNLKKDPDELHNLYEEVPEIGERLLQIIVKNLDAANSNIAAKGNH